MIFVLGSEMPHLNNNKKNNTIVTVATLFTLAFFIVGGVTTPPLTALGSRSGDGEFTDPTSEWRASRAPTVVSGDNIYIAWWTNNTQENGNEEVMFRAPTVGGATFSDKINLSNTTDSDSWRVEIAGEGDTVVVSW